MSSSNPFRKKGAQPESRFPALEPLDTATDAVPPQPKTSFRAPDLPAADKKTKPVKKVRVLSPPPLSPDSPEWPFHAPPLPQQQPGEQLQSDPFGGAAEDSDRDSTATPPPPQGFGLGLGPPANPFSKTLEDLENVKKEEELKEELKEERKEEGAALKAANAARGSLNVDAFHRLLMTGNAGLDGPASGQSSPGPEQSAPAPAKAPKLDGADSTGAPGLARPAPSETADISNQEDEEESMSDSSTNVQIGSRGKKAPPPPPSSRHGKALKLDLKDQHIEPTLPNVTSPSDVNKPLPAAPARNSLEDDSDSPFDREAAGKVPEQDAPQAPQPAPSSAKKPVPTPPPRRGHGRGESKAAPAPIATLQSQDDDSTTQSSQQSSLSRAESVRQSLHAPAPPPPRRGNAGRPAAPSPTAQTFNVTPSPSSSTPQSDLDHYISASDAAAREPPATKSSAPPPPPARNASMRRPASIISVEAPSRRISGETKGSAPPPPPPRQRGNSRSSVEGPPRRTSVDSMGKARPVVDGMTPAQADGSGADILADLTALQREVDALRGKIN